MSQSKSQIPNSVESNARTSKDVVSPDNRRDARLRAKEIVSKWTVSTIATGWVPGAGLFSAATDQMMIRQIAQCFGVAVDSDILKSHAAALLGSGIGGVASEAMGLLLPGIGWAIKGGLLSAKSKVYRR